MIQERWAQLAPRERILVAVCGAFILFALIWSLVILPLFKGSSQLAEEVAGKQAQLASLHEQAAKVSASRAAGSNSLAVNSTESLVVIIDRTTRASALATYLKRNQPEGDSEVRLRFEEAPFDLLVTWLGELSEQYGLAAVTANFDAGATGRVNCSLVLSRRTET